MTKEDKGRRDFLEKILLGGAAAAALGSGEAEAKEPSFVFDLYHEAQAAIAHKNHAHPRPPATEAEAEAGTTLNPVQFKTSEGLLHLFKQAQEETKHRKMISLPMLVGLFRILDDPKIIARTLYEAARSGSPNNDLIALVLGYCPAAKNISYKISSSASAPPFTFYQVLAEKGLQVDNGYGISIRPKTEMVTLLSEITELQKSERQYQKGKQRP